MAEPRDTFTGSLDFARMTAGKLILSNRRNVDTSPVYPALPNRSPKIPQVNRVNRLTRRPVICTERIQVLCSEPPCEFPLFSFVNGKSGNTLVFPSAENRFALAQEIVAGLKNLRVLS